MIVTALRELGEDPSFVNGGVVQAYGLSAEYGQGELFVVEADESDGSFLLYDTDISLITNVDADHLDHYGSYDAFDQAFIDFANATDELVVISSDDPGAIRIAEHIHGPRVLTFGQSPSADVWVSSISTDSLEGVTFSVKYLGNEYSTTLKIPGIHNALNAAGAFASPLKLTMAGYRRYNDGSLTTSVGANGNYWSSTISPFVSGTSNSLHIFSTAYVAGGGIRADGYSVRCIKD
jgi:UDP-N-acetylmuramate--alanine ligase